MPPKKFDQYDDNQSNCQSQLLQDVRKILAEKYTTTDKIKGWGKVVKIEFSDGTHDVELLPAWENNNGTFKIPNTENGGSWQEWNPRIEMEEIKNSDKKTEKTRILIRMIKKWSEHCSADIKSFCIERKVLDFFKIYELYNNEYSILVQKFFEFLKNDIEYEFKFSYIKTAHKRAKKACEYEKEEKKERAVDEWKKIFGDDFPKLATEISEELISENFNQQINKLRKGYPSDKENFLEKDYGIKIKINPNFFVCIDARVKQDGFREDWLSNFVKQKKFLKKKKGLKFKIIRNNVPLPYNIKWKVRNFGEEAKGAKDLRGEITDDRGFEEKIENTKYQGEHYTECYIIKDNICVAICSILVPVGYC